MTSFIIHNYIFLERNYNTLILSVFYIWLVGAGRNTPASNKTFIHLNITKTYQHFKENSVNTK